MSASFTEAAWHVALEAQPDASVIAQRAVLVAIAWRARDDGVADWPSSTYAEMAGVKARSLRYVLAALAAQGIIGAEGNRVGGRHADGRGRTTRWRLLFPSATRQEAAAFDENNPAGGCRPNPAAERMEPGSRAHGTRQGAAAPQDSKTPRLFKTPSRTPSTAQDDHRERAEALLRPWWEAQHPRPQQPWPALVKVLTKALQDGWTEVELGEALNGVRAVSGASLDYWRRSRGNGHGPAAGLTDEQHAGISAYVKRVDATRAALKKAGP